MSVRLSISSSVRLSVCPSVRLSVCPSVRLSVHRNLQPFSKPSPGSGLVMESEQNMTVPYFLVREIQSKLFIFCLYITKEYNQTGRKIVEYQTTLSFTRSGFFLLNTFTRKKKKKSSYIFFRYFLEGNILKNCLKVFTFPDFIKKNPNFEFAIENVFDCNYCQYSILKNSLIF